MPFLFLVPYYKNVIQQDKKNWCSGKDKEYYYVERYKTFIRT